MAKKLQKIIRDVEKYGNFDDKGNPVSINIKASDEAKSVWNKIKAHIEAQKAKKGRNIYKALETQCEFDQLVEQTKNGVLFSD